MYAAGDHNKNTLFLYMRLSAERETREYQTEISVSCIRKLERLALSRVCTGINYQILKKEEKNTDIALGCCLSRICAPDKILEAGSSFLSPCEADESGRYYGVERVESVAFVQRVKAP